MISQVKNLVIFSCYESLKPMHLLLIHEVKFLFLCYNSGSYPCGVVKYLQLNLYLRFCLEVGQITLSENVCV